MILCPECLGGGTGYETYQSGRPVPCEECGGPGVIWDPAKLSEPPVRVHHVSDADAVGSGDQAG